MENHTSRLTHSIYFFLKANNVNFQTELVFNPPRRWRFDFAIKEKKIAIEAEGGIYTNGRHVRAKGYTSDCEKYNTATLNGWKVFRLTDMMLKDGTLYEMLRNILTI